MLSQRITTHTQVLVTHYFLDAFLPFFLDGGVLLAFHCSASASRSSTVTKLLAKSEGDLTERNVYEVSSSLSNTVFDLLF